MTAVTGLQRPSWATGHEETEAAISWERIEQVETRPSSTEPDAAAEVIRVGAMLEDAIAVDNGRVSLTRGKVVMFVGNGDELMTVAQARTLAQTILDMAAVVEAAS